MKIAFILSGGSIAPSNGVVSQAKTWKKGLEELGHSVVLIDWWQSNDWINFDIITYFGFNSFMKEHITVLSKINHNIVVAPILDPTYSLFRLKLYKHLGIRKLNMFNQYSSLNYVKNKIKLFLVRSEFEKQYIVNGFGVKESKCKIIPLSFNIQQSSDNLMEKESFCFHVSLLMDDRKNVRRLIEAAKKYQFKLVLGGKLRNKREYEILDDWIEQSPWIEYKGYLSQKELENLYSRARVFALPSINEGVGIVALEAASLGCDIVITSLGGPKEYYNGLAKIVNPFSVDEIGKAIVEFLDGETYQPMLAKYIHLNYSLPIITKQLESTFFAI